MNIQLGELVFGGVGAGLYAMLVFVLVSVFIAGLMVGRTPEYLGKKIEAREVKLAMLYVLIFPLLILYFTGWSVVAPYGLSSLNNAGPHGLSEILYAYSSAAGNNGSAFAGLNANTPWYNVTQGLTMLAGRYLDDYSGSGDCRLYGRQESRARKLGHFPDKRDYLRGAVGRRDSYRWGVNLLPRAIAWAYRRAFFRPGRKGLLTWQTLA